MIKRFFLGVLILFLAVSGCAHRQVGVGMVAEPDLVSAPLLVQKATHVEQALSPVKNQEQKKADQDESDEYGDLEIIDDELDQDEQKKEKIPAIADPLEPFNRAMFHFNDRLYFWVLKPLALGYRRVVPEPARVGIANFFSNLAFPIRFVNSLLQGNFRGAAQELGRFTVNTLWGVGGFLDPASSKEINLLKQNEDFGQTLGVYGLGHGFFINWPLLGPSSPRDTLGFIGDSFLKPFSYLDPWQLQPGSMVLERLNDLSFRIGDYEALKSAAIDPYIALRDAYVQYRFQKVRARGSSKAFPPEAESQKKR